MATSDRRTYVLDTSVLLADPTAMTRFDEHEVVIPLVVVSELEGKRQHPELGYFARASLRLLDELRVEHGRLEQPLPIGDASMWFADRMFPETRSSSTRARSRSV